jgi:hypothetical protein
MPSNWTDLDFEMQAAGENNNTWGQNHLNNALSRINSAFGGFVSIAITGDYTMTTVRPTTSMMAADFTARIAMPKFTGSLSVNATITVPSVPMVRFVWNATNKALVFTTGAGNTFTVDAGDKTLVCCDGSNCHSITFGGYGLKDYIAAQVLASSAALPGQVGNAGKYLKTDGSSATWQQIQSSDIGDFESQIRQKVLVYTLIFGS